MFDAAAADAALSSGVASSEGVFSAGALSGEVLSAGAFVEVSADFEQPNIVASIAITTNKTASLFHLVFIIPPQL